MTLFAITSMSPIMLDLLLSEHTRSAGEVVVVTDRAQVRDFLLDYGIEAFLLNHTIRDVSERDRQFKEDLMPGILVGDVFPGTDLPLWEVLSLDRFKFWYNSDYPKWSEFISGLGDEAVYVSLDLGSTLPWTVYSWGLGEITFVKTEPIRTEEMAVFLRYLHPEKFIVDSVEDEEFLKKNGAENVTVYPKEETKKAEYQAKEELRNGLGIHSEELVYGVLFDKRDEWACRKWLEENVGKQRIFVFPTDSRSADLAPSVLHRYMGAISIMQDYTLMHACTKVFAFRFDEQYPNRDIVEEFKWNEKTK